MLHNPFVRCIDFYKRIKNWYQRNDDAATDKYVWLMVYKKYLKNESCAFKEKWSIILPIHRYFLLYYMPKYIILFCNVFNTSNQSGFDPNLRWIGHVNGKSSTWVWNPVFIVKKLAIVLPKMKTKISMY